MSSENKNIGFFDSGIGGISVLKSAVKIFKDECFIYFGDSLNSPYGSKTQNQIIDLCVNICDFLIYDKSCKAIVIACNTATSAALKHLRSIYEPDIPIIGIEPAIKPAIEYVQRHNKTQKILVLATPYTVKGERLRLAVSVYNDFNIKCIPCENLAYMIENESFSREDIKIYLKDILKEHINDCKIVVLGCTHYYFVENIIKDILGSDVRIFDGAYGTSVELKRRVDKISSYSKYDFKGQNRVFIYNSLGDSKVKRCFDFLNWEDCT